MGENTYNEDDMLFAFVHGGTRATKDNGKTVSENFKELLEIINTDKTNTHEKIHSPKLS